MVLRITLGKIQIDPRTIKGKYFSCKTFWDADELYDQTNHLFLVDLFQTSLRLSVGSKSQGNINHETLARRFDLTNVLGGGCVYLDENTLVLDNYSGDYGAVPGKTLARFRAHLLDLFELKSIRIEPFEGKIRNYLWKTL